jgi:phosphoacetylglucosamine mutase
MEVNLPPRLVEVLNDHPLPEGYAFSYGTAGFRTLGERIPPVAARMAVLIYIRGLTACSLPGPRRMGVMVTASHNAAPDNGLKIINLDGGMLPLECEPHATALANATSVEHYAAAVRVYASRFGEAAASLVTNFPKPRPDELTVVVGYDTRPSSVPSVQALVAGLEALGVTVLNLGQVTTPEVHHAVYYGAKAEDWAVVMARSFAALHAALPAPSAESKRMIVVDCANGVGAVSLQRVLKHLEGTPAGAAHEFVLACHDTSRPELLNEACGADLAQKLRKPSELMHPAVTEAFRGVEAHAAKALGVYSVDGDADRVVAFDCIDADGRLLSPGTGVLIDGDRIIALIAMTLKDIARGLGDAFNLTTGVVQTAYANGGSTKFIRDKLKLAIEMAATGVKYTHHAATHFDLGIYFEANGHGTLLIDENSRHAVEQASTDRALYRIQRLAADDSAPEHQRTAARELLLFGTLLSPSCGDAIANLFTIEYCLRRLKISFKDWLALYADLPSRQLKVPSSDHRVVKTIPNETRATAPHGLQETLDAAVEHIDRELGRTFVRPSGTEPIIRVYAEAGTGEKADQLAQAAVEALRKFAP